MNVEFTAKKTHSINSKDSFFHFKNQYLDIEITFFDVQKTFNAEENNFFDHFTIL